jgi:hypothetical protein
VGVLIWDDVPDLDEKRGMLKCAVDTRETFVLKSAYENFRMRKIWNRLDEMDQD